MARILILMSTRTYRAEAFLKAAGRLGVAVTVGTEIDQPILNLFPGSTIALDLRHPRRAVRQIVEFAREYPLDAVVGVDDDTTLPAAMAAEALGLPRNSVESVKASRYKDVARLILAETDLNTPDFELVGVDDDPLDMASRVSYPCVVKPLSLSASRGVIRADGPAEFVAAFGEVVEILREADLERDDPAARQVLVESFIPGRELALEGLLRGGELTVLALFDKPDPLDGPYFEETIYVTPSRLPEQAQTSIAEATAKAADALGLREGPIHAEIRMNQAGPWVIEVAARSVGGLCSNSLRFDFDLSLEEIILRHAAGLEIASLRRERDAAGVMMIPIPRGGVLFDVRGVSDAKAVAGIQDVRISIPRGQEVVPLPRGTKYLGFIFARARTPEAAEAALRKAHSRLEFDIRPMPRRLGALG
jgi:biotin carboxylase